MTFLEIALIAALATYRLTLMFNSENGPKDILARLRTRLGVRFDQYSNPYGTNWLSEGILCFYCLSVWIGFGVAGIVAWGYASDHIQVAVGFLLPWALSGAAIYLKKQAG